MMFAWWTFLLELHFGLVFFCVSVSFFPLGKSLNFRKEAFFPNLCNFLFDLRTNVYFLRLFSEFINLELFSGIMSCSVASRAAQWHYPMQMLPLQLLSKSIIYQIMTFDWYGLNFVSFAEWMICAMAVSRRKKEPYSNTSPKSFRLFDFLLKTHANTLRVTEKAKTGYMVARVYLIIIIIIAGIFIMCS